MDRTYYEILGLGRDASPEEVKSAYRKLCRTAHPDVGGSAALFGIVQEAYETLKNPLLRREYDDRLGGRTSAPPPRPEPPRSDPPPRTEPPRSDPPPRREPPRYPPPPRPDPPRSEPRDRVRRTPGMPPYVDVSPPADPLEPWSLKESVLGGVGLLVRAGYGVAGVGWICAVQGFRALERSLGLTWVQEPESVTAFLGSWWLVLQWFLVGAIVAVVPWEVRKEVRPFPWWEQALVYLAFAAAAPLGLWWFKGWSHFLVLVWVVAVYALLTWLRRPAGPPGGGDVPGGSPGRWGRLRARVRRPDRPAQPFQRSATGA